jgi:leader peptidase (prepilin peptidase) / N-methyltransferase
MLVEALIVAVIGLLAGGVVNALADDLPQRSSPRRPTYPDGSPRPVTAWLGITAFLLGQRASPKGSKLSWRHPLAELLTAALMVMTLVAAAGTPDINTLQLVFWLAYMAIFVLITVIDIEHKLILFVVIIPAAILAILDALITGYPPGLVDALIGGVVGFAVFFILYNGGFLFTYVLGKLRGQEINEIAFGYGDVMMATVSGLILGWQALIFAMFITVFLGAFGALLYLLVRRLAGERYSAFTALPYGPYIVAGTIIMMLYSSEVSALLLGS